MAYLVLVRHGESTWNAKGIWTGLTDVPLSQKGVDEASIAAEKIKGIPVDIVFTSPLLRAKQTWEEMNKILNYLSAQNYEDKALNERDYGKFTGRNKWDIKKELGDLEFMKIRRGWDYKIPEGETLKDVYNRVVPYYKKQILPKLKMGKNILISAHGNSLRALVKYLENISDNDIAKLEIATGEVYVYKINPVGGVDSKEIR